MDFCNSIGPSLPRRPRASVSVIRFLAAALVPWPARQLMTHYVTSPPSIDALRKLCSTISWAIAGRPGRNSEAGRKLPFNLAAGRINSVCRRSGKRSHRTNGSKSHGTFPAATEARILATGAGRPHMGPKRRSSRRSDTSAIGRRPDSSASVTKTSKMIEVTLPDRSFDHLAGAIRHLRFWLK